MPKTRRNILYLIVFRKQHKKKRHTSVSKTFFFPINIRRFNVTFSMVFLFESLIIFLEEEGRGRREELSNNDF